MRSLGEAGPFLAGIPPSRGQPFLTLHFGANQKALPRFVRAGMRR